MAGEVDFSLLASVDGAESYKEAAIILEGPPIQIFGQRAAPTVVLRPLQQRAGCFYYECQTDTRGYMQLGWADDEFKAIATDGKGAGDDAHSWAFDGYRVLKWHQNKKASYGRRWKAGDTIGIATDLLNGSITFYINGESLDVAFCKIKFTGSLYPCISLCRGERVTLRFGLTRDDAFKYPLPPGYSGLTISIPQQVSEEKYDKYCSSASVIKMGMSDHSFVDSYPGEVMVTMMGRGLDYEATKNGMIHAGYEATIKRFEEHESELLSKTSGIGLTKNELFALICYTLEKPPVYQYFNKDTRDGYQGDGMDFPIITYLLREGCKKILKSAPSNERVKVVYRGVSVPFSAEVGQKIRFGCFTSTSASPAKAKEFQKKPTGTTFIITTKLGAGIKMLSAYPEEDEVLIPPHEVFRITKVEGTRRIFCESETTDEFLEIQLS